MLTKFIRSSLTTGNSTAKPDGCRLDRCRDGTAAVKLEPAVIQGVGHAVRSRLSGMPIGTIPLEFQRRIE
jgi:hypothetical protein